MTIPGAIWGFEAALYEGDVDVMLYLEGLERTADLDAFIADTVSTFGKHFITSPGAAKLWQGTFGPSGADPLFGVALFVRGSGALHFMAFSEERDADVFFAECAAHDDGTGRIEVFNGLRLAHGGRS